jgi:hypothetical protein
MLFSSSRYSREVFLKNNRLFLDSGVLLKWADDPQLDILFTQVESLYSVLLCTVSLLEVGFGPSGKASASQIVRAGEIYDLAFTNPVDNSVLGRSNPERVSLPSRSTYNPNHHEWFAARTVLLRLIDTTGREVKNARQLANDALIYYCAWNGRAAIVTNNLKDFVLLNALQNPQRTQDGHLRHVPIYTVEDLKNSLSGDISYPENIPLHLRGSLGF